MAIFSIHVKKDVISVMSELDLLLDFKFVLRYGIICVTLFVCFFLFFCSGMAPGKKIINVVQSFQI